MLLKIGGFREKCLQKYHDFLQVSKKLRVCACHVTVWHFEMVERLGKFCVPYHGIKCVQSCLKNSPTKVELSAEISIVNLPGLYFNIFCDTLILVHLAVH